MKKGEDPAKWNKDKVWNKIEDELHQKKKRRFLYWKLLGGISTIIIVACLLKLKYDKVHQDEPLNEIKHQVMKNTYPIETSEETSLEKVIVSKKGSKIAYTEKAIEIQNLSIDSQNSIQNLSNSKSLKRDDFLLDPVSIGVNSVDIKKNEQDKITLETKLLQNVTEEINLSNLPSLPLGLLTADFNSEENISLESLNSMSADDKTTFSSSSFWWIENGLNFGERREVNLIHDFQPRNTTEEFRFMHTTAFGIQKFLSKAWSLKLALAYQTIYEKYENAPSFEVEEEKFSEEATVYNLSNGITYYEAGFSTHKFTRTRAIIHNNFIHRLSIPMEGVFSFSIYPFSIDPSFGIRLQYFQRFNGIIAQNEDPGHLFDTEEINEIYYPNNFGLGFLAALNFKLEISESASLGLKLNYEKDDFLNLVKTSYSSKYETMGLQLGYYHSFD